MTLILHRGAEAIGFDALKAVATPEATSSHIPLAHYQLVEMARYALGYYGHEIVEENHAVTSDGLRYFGLMVLRSAEGQYTDTLGLRNSNDKIFPIGLAYGARVMVCDNLSFHGDYVIKRKHTANSRRELPGLVSELIEPLALKREAQAQTFLTYQETPLTETEADHVIMSLYREQVINVQRIADVERQWQEPTHDWGEKTAWRLFNAATFALNGKVLEDPQATPKLHRILDLACTRH